MIELDVTLPDGRIVHVYDTGDDDRLPVLWHHGSPNIGSPHGGRDGVVPASHDRWLADRCPTAEPGVFPDDGHITVLDHGEAALAWIAGHRPPGSGVSTL